MTHIRRVHIPLLAALLTCSIAPVFAAIHVADRSDQAGRPGVLRPKFSDAQVRKILEQISSDASALRRSVEQSNPRGRAVGNPRVAANDNTVYLIDGLVQSAEDLTRQLSRSQVAGESVDDVLRHALELDRAIANGPSRPAVTSAWTRLRRSVDQLADAYSMNWDWQNPRDGFQDGRGEARSFSGTYRLSPADSDDPRIASERAMRGVAAGDRGRISRQMEARLTPPDTIALERRGDRVTIASSQGPQTTFDADGQARNERGPGGRDTTTRAIARGDELEVNTTGSSADFSVTFQSVDDGRTLAVTRRLYSDSLRDPIVVRSIYRRVSDVADWNVYDTRDSSPRATPRPGANGMLVPAGTTFTATLDRALNARKAREGDRIALTVQAGNEFRDATIEGVITTEPTRASSRVGISIAFDRIRLRDGRTGDFDGTIIDIRDPDGRSIGFDRAEASDDDARGDAVQRGAIGAAIGAVLGAAIGGGKGAAIGAVLGAGGGAGTVLLDTQSQSDLPRGTTFRIRAETLDIR